MPRLIIPELDEQPQYDYQNSAVGGMVSFPRLDTLSDKQVAYLENFDISSDGLAVTRRGTQRFANLGIPSGNSAQGLGFVDHPVQGQVVFIKDGSGTSTIKFSPNWNSIGVHTNASFGVGDIVNFTQGLHQLYFINRNGQIGTHLYSYNTQTTTLSDVWAFQGTTNLKPITGPCELVWHTSRLIMAGYNGGDNAFPADGVYFSGILDSNIWDRTNLQIRVGGGESGRILAIQPWGKYNLVVFKNSGTYIIDCNPSVNVPDFTIEKVPGRHGCNCPGSVCEVANDVFFLNQTGVRSIQRSLASDNNTQLGDAISWPIHDIIKRINWNAAPQTAASTYWNNNYILSVPLDASPTNNYLLIYNTVTGSWSGLWSGIGIDLFCIRTLTDGTRRLLMAQNSPTPQISEFLDFVAEGDVVDSTYQDSGVDIESTYTTRGFTFGDPSVQKQGFNFEAEFFRSVGDMQPTVILDGTQDPNYPPFSTGGTGLTFPADHSGLQLPQTFPKSGVVTSPLTDLLSKPDFRELQIKLYGKAGKKVVRRVSVAAYLEAAKVQE